MTRPRKATVDYFPHSCEHGKTIFVLLEQYDIQGYFFWFRLLELLGSTENHFIDCNNPASWRFLTSKTRTTPEKAEDILQCLADMEAIDPELWKSKIIWSQNFVDGIADAYRNRKIDIPIRPDILRKKPVSEGKKPDDIVSYPETKLNEMKVNISSSAVADDGVDEIPFDEFWTPWPKKVGKEEAKKAWKKLKAVDRMAAIAGIKKQSQAGGNLTNEKRLIKHPQGWLNNRRWEDELIPNGNGNGSPFKPKPVKPPDISQSEWELYRDVEKYGVFGSREHKEQYLEIKKRIGA